MVHGNFFPMEVGLSSPSLTVSVLVCFPGTFPMSSMSSHSFVEPDAKWPHDFHDFYCFNDYLPLLLLILYIWLSPLFSVKLTNR